MTTRQLPLQTPYKIPPLTLCHSQLRQFHIHQFTTKKCPKTSHYQYNTNKVSINASCIHKDWIDALDYHDLNGLSVHMDVFLFVYGYLDITNRLGIQVWY